jgi:colicin import membrane protein/protein TonB
MAVIPVTTALRRKDRLWPTVTFSAAAHAALIVWVLVRVPAPTIDLDQKPIVAKLVRLGPKKPPEYLPRKEAPPPPAPAEAAPTPVAAPAPAAPAAPIAAIAKADPKPAPPKAQSPNPGKATGNPLSSVLSKVRASAAKEEPQYGDPDGDPLGDSEEGSEGDKYIALVKREIQANYRVPATIPERERLYLKAQVRISIEPDGRIARWSFVSRSGNGVFDDAVERTLRQVRVPPPPQERRDLFRGGVVIEFTGAGV